MADKKQAVSPRNGQPVPRGRKFTSETAREAQKAKTQKERAKKSISAAFLQYMVEYIAKDEHGNPITGAQAIAKSIIKGASKGNAEMVKIALAITGETPAIKIEQTVIDETTRAAVEDFVINGLNGEEPTD